MRAVEKTGLSSRLTLRHLFYFRPCPLQDLLFSFYVDPLSLVELEGLSNKPTVLELLGATKLFIYESLFMIFYWVGLCLYVWNWETNLFLDSMEFSSSLIIRIGFAFSGSKFVLHKCIPMSSDKLWTCSYGIIRIGLAIIIRCLLIRKYVC